MARDVMWLGCELEHDWQSSGGRNAGCERGDWCACSVPVHVCARCGDCDYGENAEASDVRRSCRETWDDPISYVQ